MRQQYVQTNNRKKAIKLCPWAEYVIKVEDGYHCFESYNDYKTWKNQI
jgi:hypothetical protein